MLAAMLRLAPGEIEAGTSLASLDNSLGEARLRLGMKRLGLQLPAGARPATVGQLRELLGPAGKTAVHNSAVTLSGLPPGLRVGIDIQDIGALPPAADYRNDDFYRGIFAKTEIAYAIMQTEPRTHFAGFWCAKEALRKCDPAFSQVEPHLTAIEHDESHRPYFLWTMASGETRLPHAVSISHTAAMATAIVIAGWPASGPGS